jgi:hypothetical protein
MTTKKIANRGILVLLLDPAATGEFGVCNEIK